MTAAGEGVDGAVVEPTAATGCRRLNARVMRLWRLRLGAGAVIALAVAVGLGWTWEGGIAAMLGGVGAGAVGAAIAVLLPPARYRAWRFRLREGDLVVRRGVLWRTVSVVPHARIQHVDTRHGPLERRLGLSRVIVHTAGSTGASVEVPGLSLEEAEALRERLAALGGGDDAV